NPAYAPPRGGGGGEAAPGPEALAAVIGPSHVPSHLRLSCGVRDTEVEEPRCARQSRERKRAVAGTSSEIAGCDPSPPLSYVRGSAPIYCECDSDTGGSLDRPEGAGAWRRPPVAFDRRGAVLWGHGADLEYPGLGAPGPPNSGGGDCAAAPERTRHRTLCSRSAFARQSRRTRGGESNALRRDGGEELNPWG